MRRRTRSRWPAALFVILFVLAAGGVAWIYLQRPARHELQFSPVAFSSLPGWDSGDPTAALAAFRRSCDVTVRRPPALAMGGSQYLGHVRDWVGVCADSRRTITGAAATRAWFESRFAVFRLHEGAKDEALFTGYYEPEIRGSRIAHAPFATPIYGLPRDLVTVDLAQFRRDLPQIRLVGRLSGTKVVPFPTRAAIDARELGDAPILLYAADPVSVFFLHIQGSGRVRLENGAMLRLAYAGQNGRPYTPIGRTLIEQGALDRQHMSMQAIRAWLQSHPMRARAIMESDQSFVFFRELPIGDPALGSPGSEGVPLTAETSLAVDPATHAFGVPMYVATTAPAADARELSRAFDRLLIAQDTGGAIKGAMRADIFWGFGRDAESVAGRMEAEGGFFVLLPKSLAARMPPQILSS